ncbi:splicing factor, putative [Entamoeba histolytica HM-1:IMSS-B]|uniref:Splicing factor 3a subunit 2, putative n=6 Tax=Entamoeba histolytica TaxID=5759 RepID=C4LYX8_ENTH1|nr:splicing factor 3a subunit 2, putative [Entamoeba histolytica HM-1:IMSS]EMD42720.1 splicing factor 3a subunit 2, putative [Entamoeba histolytica KU27]EMH72963.1 splicing factor, putative [Entamoeba histolytica HM-1:IMSS-B]EMS15684.1 splicing factor 3a subunit 2, putative [Entamoeba histolytica HM-3:IMSS]ENY63364.1 splicing factor 3a subunit 2, putative [Entamoeba histolytica HM-1:IMSS-A]GAT94045.1 splicing factor 3a subunit 2 putative [Entamoeba histolytica]|eukprot:XP_656062.1 splicing factor 3a subunit 2, putative [Entamoeba histolytica HM-1:IMSS]
MFGREHGSKPGSGGLATLAETAAARKERLKQLALERIDLSKDPYFYKTHVGTYQCKLCLTTHLTEANYLAHTQGKRHQQNLRARELKEMKMHDVQENNTAIPKVPIRYFEKIGTPGFSITKQIDSTTHQKSLAITVNLPDIANGVIPLFKIMGAFEQHVEPPDNNYQYLIIAAEPYQSIAFKIPNMEVELDETTGKYGEERWEVSTHTYYLKINFVLN